MIFIFNLTLTLNLNLNITGTHLTLTYTQLNLHLSLKFNLQLKMAFHCFRTWLWAPLELPVLTMQERSLKGNKYNKRYADVSCH